MKVPFEQLGRRLGKGLDPVYLISGEEPLQVEESLDLVRAAARDSGIEERVVLHVEAGFDWDCLREYQDSLSLFGDRRMVDLRLPGGPGKDGGAMLRAWAERPNPDCVLLVSSSSMDWRTASSAWAKALEKAGVHVRVNKVGRADLPDWIRSRAARNGLELTAAAAASLAERNEGNMLACSQEIEKLRLLGAEGPLDERDILEQVSDSSRFGAFDLVNAAIDGDTARTVRILRILREEGAVIPMLLGSVGWALRNFSEAARRSARGEPLDSILSGPGFGQWRRERGRIRDALGRGPLARWTRLLRYAHDIDLAAKGYAGRPGPDGTRVRPDPWDLLRSLMVAFSTGEEPPAG